MTYIAILLAVGMLITYRVGIKDGMSISNGGTPSITPRIPKKAKTPDRAEIIRQNIENYNGSGEGQVKLDV